MQPTVPPEQHSNMELEYTVSLLFESAPTEDCLERVRERFDAFLKALQEDDLDTELFDASYALSDEHF